MSWEMEKETTQIARKEYHCNASDWIDNAGLEEADYKPLDWARIQAAKAEGFKILKGAEYIKISGKWDGEFSVFRARPELEKICVDYGLYSE